MEKYEELVERLLESMALVLADIAEGLKMSIHIDATFYSTVSGVDVSLFPRTGVCVSREVEKDGDLEGIIDEAFCS